MGTRRGSAEMRVIGIVAVALCVLALLAVLIRQRTSVCLPELSQTRMEVDVSGPRPGNEAGGYSEVETIRPGLQVLTGVAVAPDGRIVIVGDRVLLLVEPRSAPAAWARVGLPTMPRCVAADESGALYVGFEDRVRVLDPEGNVRAEWQPLGERALLTSIVGSPASIWVADAGNRVVWRYAPDGTVLGSIDGRAEGGPGFVIPSPFFDLMLDSTGLLWIVNPGRHSLVSYGDDGRVRASWGEWSAGLDGFCGCCNPIHIAALTDGSFVTSEKGFPRVKIHDPAGRFSELVVGPEGFDQRTSSLDLAVDQAGRIVVLDPARKEVRIFARTEAGHEQT